MKKLVIMIALFGMSFAFNACTDPIDEIQDGFAQENVSTVEGDGGNEDDEEGWLGDDGE